MSASPAVRNAAADRPVNFSAGPAILPLEVLEEAARGVIALDGIGLSVMEISHRSAAFETIYERAHEGLKRLLRVPDTHEVLFLQGGARGQFAQVPLNFLKQGQTARFVVSGYWAQGALEEAATLGQAEALVSSEDRQFAELPSLDGVDIPKGTAYVHTTSNNTLYGTQWPQMPSFGPDVRHVCDMSSDILSRPIDVSDYALIYAGAQKNAGPSGITIVIVDKQWMAEGRQDIPKIWRYDVMAKNQSMYNTPPTFAIYCVDLVAQWLEGLGGLDAIAERNETKARLLYDAIDGSGGFYRGTVTRPEHRSRMTVTYRLPSEQLDKQFVAESAGQGLVGLKGHRAVGGIRASIYNAMDVAGVERLVDFMQDFARRHG